MYHSQPHAYQPPSAPGYQAAQPAKFITVGAYDNYFVPKMINIEPGMTVRWVNYGRHMHTVTAADGRWDSRDIRPGASYSATFQYPGAYSYYCRHHTMDKMEGSVAVRDGSSGTPATDRSYESSDYQRSG